MFLNPPVKPSGRGILNCNVSWCRLLWVHLINVILVLPETECLFPFPNWGSFQLLLLQNQFSTLSLCLLLLEPLIPDWEPLGFSTVPSIPHPSTKPDPWWGWMSTWHCDPQQQKPGFASRLHHGLAVSLSSNVTSLGLTSLICKMRDHDCTHLTRLFWG